MESRIIYHIDKFIAFLFGEENYNDPEQRIYNKLLRLEEDELETWINTKIKNYIIGKGDFFEFKGFEGIYGPIIFKSWYIVCNNTGEVMSMKEIFGETRYILIKFKEEYKIIKDKIQAFKKKNVYYDIQLDWEFLILTDYLEMFIMKMNSEDLKTYIIEQVSRLK